MTALLLAEAGPPVTRALPADQARALAAAPFLDVAPSAAAPGQWQIRARQSVGAARIGGIEVRIRPKVPIARLLFLLGYARDPNGWRAEEVGFDAAADLVPALAQALWRQAERALRPGVLQGYRIMESTSPILRGRLRETDQLRRWHGLPLPMEVRYDEYTVDIAENQILAAAILRMLRVPGVDASSQRKLRHLAARLATVSPLLRGAPLPAWQPNRLNARYHTALRLAEIVLTNGSIENRVGDVRANGFIVDMWRVYEEFLSVALSQSLSAGHGGRIQLQRRDHLDERRTFELRPDLVWHRQNRIEAVIDAKYKAHTPEADLYQMLAYCTVYGLRHGHLVYVQGERVPQRHVIRRAGTVLVSHSLDLDQPPGQLLADVASLAEVIAANANAASTIATSFVSS